MDSKNKGLIFLYCVLIFLLGACSPGEEAVFLERWSPNEDQLLRITIAEPAALPGCDYCRRPFFVSVYLIDKTRSAEKKIISTRLENDGVPFGPSNIVARWTGEKIALICLRASSLPARGYRILLKEKVSVIETEGC
tara:strand:+ start:1554 stop:1964 length:411 start_codon:yes stop_codon:yes gene_type:complete